MSVSMFNPAARLNPSTKEVVWVDPPTCGPLPSTHTYFATACGVKGLAGPEGIPSTASFDEPTGPALNESLLITHILAGDSAAFAALLRPHLRLFTHGIHRILQDAQDTQDALEEALLDIHAELPSFGGSSKFSTWAYHICLNQALQLRLARMRRGKENSEDLLPRFSAEY